MTKYTDSGAAFFNQSDIQSNEDELKASLSKIDPKKLSIKVAELGYEYTEKKAAANILEEGKKSYLARLAREFKIVGKFDSSGNRKELTSTEADQMALASNDYEDYLKKMVEARRECDKAWVRFEVARQYMDMLRTAIVSHREILKK